MGFHMVRLRKGSEYIRTGITIDFSSVSDPSHFDVDPDPDPGIHIWKSGSESGSWDPHFGKVDPDPDPRSLFVTAKI